MLALIDDETSSSSCSSSSSSSSFITSDNNNNNSSSGSGANSHDQNNEALKNNIVNKLVHSINTSILPPTQSISIITSLLLYSSIMMIFPTLQTNNNNNNISTINNITNNFNILFPLFETVCQEIVNQLEMSLILLKYFDCIDNNRGKTIKRSRGSNDIIFDNKKNDDKYDDNDDDDDDNNNNNDNNNDIVDDIKSNRDNVVDNNIDKKITDNSIEISYKMIVLLYTTIRQILHDISIMIQIIITIKSTYGSIIIITLYDHKHNNTYVQSLLHHLHQYNHTLLQIINKIYTYLHHSLITTTTTTTADTATTAATITNTTTSTTNSSKSYNTSAINTRSDSHTILINSVLHQLQLTKLHIKNFQGLIEGNKTKKSD